MSSLEATRVRDLRGKLDVPKERIISYYGCESDEDHEPVLRLGQLEPPPARSGPRHHLLSTAPRKLVISRKLARWDRRVIQLDDEGQAYEADEVCAATSRPRSGAADGARRHC
jgi:hypothetical protein